MLSITYALKTEVYGMLASIASVTRGKISMISSSIQAKNRIYQPNTCFQNILLRATTLIFSVILYIGHSGLAFADQAIATATQFQVWAPGTSAENFDGNDCRQIFAGDVKN